MLADGSDAARLRENEQRACAPLKGYAVNAMRRAAASLAVLLVASACGMSTVDSTAVKQCSANSDCPAGDSCQFSVYASCPNAGAGEPTGVCIRTPDGSACVSQTACGCNGVTVTICLVNGNAPSPVVSLGSCDGATQQGFDANVPPLLDATAPSSPDAADSSTSMMPPEDSAPPPQDSAPPPVNAADAADSAPASTLGSPCTSSVECTDPVYNTCKTISGTKICTTTCVFDTDCQPPADGFCDAEGYCELQ